MTYDAMQHIEEKEEEESSKVFRREEGNEMRIQLGQACGLFFVLLLNSYSIFGTRSALASDLVIEAPKAGKRFALEVAGDATAARATCTLIHQQLTLAFHEEISTECYQGKGSVTNKSEFDYYVQYDDSGANTILTIERPKDGDSPAASWKINPSKKFGESEKIESTQKLINRFAVTDKSSREVKEYALLSAIHQKKSDVIALDSQGHYVKQKSLEVLEFDDAYRLYQDEKPEQKNYLRATIEIVTLIGLGAGWYWKDHAFNEPDWDLGWNWASWRKKLITGEGISTDTNHFETNTVMHPLTGMLYYQFSRANGFNSLESLLVATTASLLWEYFIEFREKVSFNDCIVTPAAGAAIGEVFSQLGAFFDRSSDNVAYKILANIFGGPKRFHDWLDDNKPRKTADLDRFGLTLDRYHEFEFWFGMGTHRTTGGDLSSVRHVDTEVGLRTLIVNVPEYGHAGKVTKILTDGNFTEMLVKGAGDETGLSDFEFFVKAALAGYYTQDVIEKEGKLQGYSFFIGAANGFDYTMRDRPGVSAESVAWTKEMGATLDKAAIVNVLGTTIDFNYYSHGVKLHAILDVFGDFAVIRSYAMHDWRLAHPDEKMREILSSREYYYAFGITVSSKITAETEHFEFKWNFKNSMEYSLDGWDRRQDLLPHDQKLSERITHNELSAAFKLPGDWARLALSMEYRYRDGTVDEVDVNSSEFRYMAKLVFRF